MKTRGSERIEFLGTDPLSTDYCMIDLSSTGVAIVHPTPKDPGSSVIVKIKDYDLDCLVVYCKERTDGFRLGLHFRNIPRDKKEKLASYVADFSRGVPLTCKVIDGSRNQDKG